MTATLSTRLRTLSFLLIVLVVFLHAVNTTILVPGLQDASLSVSLPLYVQQFINQGITRIAVPLFFAISGYLFFCSFQPTARQFRAKYRRRARSLLAPYLIWSAAGIVLFYLLQTLPASKPYFTDPANVIRNLSAGELARKWLLDPINYPLWFVRDLIVLTSISPLIYLLVRWLGLGVLLPLGGLWLLGLSPPLMLGLRPVVSMPGLFFFMLGSYLALRKPLDLERDMAGSKALAAVWLGLLAVKTYLEIYQGRESTILAQVSIALGVVALWTNYRSLQPALEGRVGIWLTQFTFFVYAGHEPLLTILKKLFVRLFGLGPWSQLLAFFLLPVLAIAVCVSVAAVMKRFFRPVYLVMTGGR